MRVLWGILIGVLFPVGVWAEPVPSQSDAMRRRIAADRVKSRFLENEEASLLEGLKELEAGIEVRRKLSTELELELVELEVRTQHLEDKLREHNVRLADIRERFSRRAAAMLRLRRTRLVRLLKYARSPNDLRRLKERLARISTYDLELMTEVRAAGADDRKIKTQLDAQKKEVAETRKRFQTENEEEMQLQAQRTELLEAIRREKTTTQRLARELSKAARRLDEERGRVLGAEPAPEPRPGGFKAQKRYLAWPTSGTLEVAFGRKVDPVSNVVLPQKGIDLRAKQSAPVRSIFKGKVVYARRMKGYGRLIILQHDTYHSLYGHLESFSVKEGQTVTRQQVIGYVGDSDSTKGAYLYFELRNGREPVDPLNWLAR